jgi:hypothetical protein
LIRDHDSKFAGSFYEVFRSEEAEVIRIPIGAPLANSVAEHFVGSLRRECILIFGRMNVLHEGDLLFGTDRLA